jgi:hypothetical protein
MKQVQQAIGKRELETANGSQEHQIERQRFKEIDSIMAPWQLPSRMGSRTGNKKQTPPLLAGLFYCLYLAGHSRHCENIRRSIDVFLEKHDFSLLVFEHVGPFILYRLARLLCPRGQDAQGHDGVTLLNHFARCELAEL